MFSATTKSVSLLLHLEGRLMQKDSRDLVPFSINAAFQPLEVIFLPSDDMRQL